MAEWKKVLVSGSNIDVAQISASVVPTVDTEDNLLAITTDGHIKQILQSNVAGSDTMGNGFILEDGDSTEVQITENKEVKFVEGSSKIDINWTNTSNGTDGDPYDLTFDVNANNVFTAIDTTTVGTFTSSFAETGSYIAGGNVDGTVANATDATNASKIYVTNDDTGDTTNPILFVNSGGNGNRSVFEDQAFYFDNSNDILYVPNVKNDDLIVGRATGNDHIDFGTAGSVLIQTNNVSRLIQTDTLTDVKQNLIVRGGEIQGGSATVALLDNATVDTINFGRNAEAITIGNSGDSTVTIQGSASIAGDLTVSGTTTTLNTQNLLVEDRYILLGSSSAANIVGGGIVIANTDNNTDGTGTALFYDKATRRWSIDAAGADPTDQDGADSDLGIVTVEITTNTDPDNSQPLDNPQMGTANNNQGQMWVNRTPAAGESGIWIYG